ncbi:hypothetical protein AAIR29_10020 [Psychrobacter sp. FBL11]|uniref:Lipoprotein n=1 Tax=Psychrobacter saeujeotis TaxID=3143436 RepID=A0ABU9XCA8_9GAMM|nr:hypothetical protein [uncultured Psychrobacter sp.]
MVVSITACNDSDIEQGSIPVKGNVTQVKAREYNILEDTVKSNIKRTVEVELPERLDEVELKRLAEHIKGLSNKDLERTFIGYRIAGNDPKQAYWATTHYNPNLEVNIMGESATSYESMKGKDLPEGDVIGSWMVEHDLEYRVTAYNKDEQTYLQNAYGDGTSSDDLYVLSETDRGTKLEEEDSGFGEYFIINSEGELEFWSDNGNYYTAKKSNLR